MRKILIIDDEKDIRLLLKDILEEEGYEVFEAAHSMQAEMLLNQHEAEIGAIILDIWLENSEKDGLELLKDVKKKQKKLPVIMISGHGNISMAVKAIKYGAYDFIEKPFKSERLLITLKNAIESADLSQINHKLQMSLANEKLEHILSPDHTHGKDDKPAQQIDVPNLYHLSLKEAREEFEKMYLNEQIKRFDGNISKTAQFVNMERTALHRKLKSLGLTEKEKTAKAANDS